MKNWLLDHLKLPLFALAILLCAPSTSAQTDNFIASGSVSPYLTLGRSLVWGGTGLGTVGQNFIFNPLDPNQGFCVFIFNNNPSSAHSFTITVGQTGDPIIKTYANNTAHWSNVPTTTSFPATVAANTLIGINYKTTASAVIAISFTGNTTQAGSPDSADIFTVQTNQSSCGTLSSNSVQGVAQQGTTETLSNQFPVQVGGLAAPGSTGQVLAAHVGTAGNGWLVDGGVCCQAFASGFQSNPAGIFSRVSSANGPSTELESVIDNFSMGFFGNKGTAPGYVKTNPLEIATDQFWQTQSNTPAWVLNGKATNPAANQVLLSQFLTNAAAVNIALKWLILDCSAACEILVARETAVGTGCTTLTAQNLQFGNNGVVLAPAAAETLQNNCVTTAPTLGTTMFDIPMGANQWTSIDMAGFANFHNATAGSGIAIEVVTGFTGVATAQLVWVEQ